MQKMFVDHHFIILEWFVKDHVTLKTGVIMINSGINYTLLYIHVENRWFTKQKIFCSITPKKWVKFFIYVNLVFKDTIYVLCTFSWNSLQNCRGF